MGGALVDWFDLAYGDQAHLLTISYEADEEVTFASELLHAQHIIKLRRGQRARGPAGQQECCDVSFANV